MGPIEILLNEHALIRQAIDNLSIGVEKLEDGEKIPEEFFEKAIEFARTFVDKFHHFKEEYIMFSQLAQKKEGHLDAQIEALRHQHERGRNYIVNIADSLKGYLRGEEIQTTTLLENLAAYISVLRHHIHREDNIFYPIAEKEFSEKEKEIILEAFKKEDEKANSRTTEEGKRLLREMGACLK